MAEVGSREALFVGRIALCSGCKHEGRSRPHWLIIPDGKHDIEDTRTLHAKYRKGKVREYCSPGSLVVLEALDDFDRCYDRELTPKDTQWDEFRLWKIVEDGD